MLSRISNYSRRRFDFKSRGGSILDTFPYSLFSCEKDIPILSCHKASNIRLGMLLFPLSVVYFPSQIIILRKEQLHGNPFLIKLYTIMILIII